MAQKLFVQAKILSKVENLMLKGFTRPFQIKLNVSEIKDDHTAKTYIEAVESMWLEKNINSKTDRMRIIKKSELFERERSNDAEQTSNENAKVGFLKLAFDALKFQAKMLGLESQEIEIEKKPGLSQETLEKLDQMYAMNSRK